MKVIDETGAVLTAEPDLDAGYLVESMEVVHHETVEAVAEQWHREVATLPDGSPAIYYRDGKEIGRDTVKVIDVPGIPAQPAWDEEVPVLRYIRYTAEELAQREAEKKAAEDAKAEADRKQAEQEALPQRVADLEAENTRLKEQLDAQESSMTDLQLALCSLYEQAEGSETE